MEEKFENMRRECEKEQRQNKENYERVNSLADRIDEMNREILT